MNYLDKILSARFLITIAIGFTYCHIVVFTVYAYMDALKGNPDKVEAFATGLMVGFSGLATLIIKSYFDRSDRAPEVTK